MATALGDLTDEFKDEWLENPGSVYTIDRRWCWQAVAADSMSCLGFHLVHVSKPPQVDVAKHQCVQGAEADILRSWKNERHNGWQKGKEAPVEHQQMKY